MVAQYKKPHFLKFFTLSLVAALLSIIFVFVGAPLLRVIRNQFGFQKYWLMGFLFILLTSFSGLIHLAFLLGSVWLVIGLYSELEEKGYANFWSALAVIIFGTAVVVIGPLLWAKSGGIDLYSVLKVAIEQFLKQVQINVSTEEQNLISGLKFDTNLLISQIPSVMFILHLLGLSFALIMDRKTATMFGLRFEKIASQIRLLEFRVPDIFIWITMFSFLLSFLKAGNETMTLVSMNIFNSLMGIYFLQGLAVLEVFLLVFRAGTFTRVFTYLVVVGQFFFLVSIVGIIDFWADFRKRLRNRGIRQNNQNNGEHI